MGTTHQPQEEVSQKGPLRRPETQLKLTREIPKNVHPLLKDLFTEDIPVIPLAGRLKHFTKNWEKITNDQNILKVIRGLKLDFIQKPHQNQGPHPIRMGKEDRHLMQLEIESMLEKGAIQPTKPSKDQFVSTVFLREKKDGGQRPIINLKKLNKIIPYIHFKMESISLLKDLLEQDDLMVKLDLKDAYFSVALHVSMRRYMRFRWEGTLYEFICLCFGLGPGPRIFTKIMKVPITLLRRLNIRLIIYLDDMLILGRTIEEAIKNLNTVIYFLEHLGFVINIKKSVTFPTREIEFLGFLVNSTNMTIALSPKKIADIMCQCAKKS